MEKWRPGSFTKNFSWGPLSHGLKQLYDAIRVGFELTPKPVSRDDFRRRIAHLGRPDFIPMNFFLFNEVINGKSFIAVDELVFQAITFRHSTQFDKLALFAFHFSHVGYWQGAAHYQSEPALWARRYIQERVGRQYNWTVNSVSADDIENFISADQRYTAATSRKLSTNLNYLLRAGKLSEFARGKPERWWLSSLFLALDRTHPQIPSPSDPLAQADLRRTLEENEFWDLSGKRSLEKEIAAGYFLTLYEACGGRNRFSVNQTVERQRSLMPEHLSNNQPQLEGIGVLHPSNPTARNAIPEVAMVLAKYLAGFEVFDLDEDHFDVSNFVRQRTDAALQELRARGVDPTLSGDEATRLLRGE